MVQSENIFEEHLEISNSNSVAVVEEFIKRIGGEKIDDASFVLGDEKWWIDFHIFTHSNDIIVEEKIAEKYDKFLLIKTGSDRTIIYGWCDKKLLTSLQSKDLYRNGTKVFLVVQDNLNTLTNFKILKENYELKKEFIINQEQADEYGHTEMISGILAGLHYFCKKAGLYFKDINQKDECILGDKKIKIYTRDYLSDEDMLISEEYYEKHPEIELFILCKIKAQKYNYLGYITKSEVDRTKVVQMTGNVDMDGTGEKVRRIFSDQYKKLTDFLKIYEEIKKEEKIIIQQSYAPLHCHSEWSIGDGFGSTDYIAECLRNQGFKACALTDHGTLAGVWNWQKSCLLQEIKPIIGCEFYLNTSETDGRFHLTVLVKNEAGWKNILKLQAKAVREGFYYKPIININDIYENSEGLIILSGCMLGLLNKLIEQNKISEAEEIIKKFKEVFKEDYYFEIMPHNIKDNQKTLEKLYSLSLKYNIKCVLTTDSHYPLKEDKKFHDAVKAISFKKKYGEAGFDDSCFYLMQDKDIEEKINQDCLWMQDKYKEFMQNTLEIVEKCNFKIEPGKEKDTLPKFCSINNSERYFEKNIKIKFEEWKKRLLNNEEKLLLSLYPKQENE